MDNRISQADGERREMILNGPLGKALAMVAMPLVLHQCLFFVFQLIDTSVSAGVSSKAVSAIYYISQVITVLASMGQGLAVGAGIKIATAYGAGKYDEAHEHARSMYMLCGMVCVPMLAVCIPFAESIMRLARTPESFLELGRAYFIISITATAVDIFNSAYLATERARGNTKRILMLNFWKAALKLALTWLLVWAVGRDMAMLAATTLAANLFMSTAAALNLRREKGIFSITKKDIKWKGNTLGQIVKLAVPSTFEKAFFHVGKLFTNFMMVFYGSTTVGAFSVAQSMSILINGAQTGFQDAAATVINQNRGNQNYRRVLDTFKYTMVFSVAAGLFGACVVTVFREALYALFSPGEASFAADVFMLNRFFAVSLTPMGISCAVVALLYGFGKTKWAMSINFIRLFVLRIPLLWYFENCTSMGMEAVGLSLVISNIITAAVSLAMAAVLIKAVCREHSVEFTWRRSP